MYYVYLFKLLHTLFSNYLFGFVFFLLLAVHGFWYLTFLDQGWNQGHSSESPES